MNKTELVSAIADNSGLSKRDAEKALTAFTSIVTDELKNGNSVQLVGFGTFGVSERAAHDGINPRTKEKIRIEAKAVPTFKAGKALKDAVR